MRMMGMLAAGRAVPLRREVPRRACPEAQGGRAWLTVELVALCLCIGRFPEGRVPRRRRVVHGCQSSFSCCAFVELVVLCLCVRRFPKGRVPRRRRVVLATGRAGRTVPLRREVSRRGRQMTTKMRTDDNIFHCRLAPGTRTKYSARCVSHKGKTFVVYHKVKVCFACGKREFSKISH